MAWNEKFLHESGVVPQGFVATLSSLATILALPYCLSDQVNSYKIKINEIGLFPCFTLGTMWHS